VLQEIDCTSKKAMHRAFWEESSASKAITAKLAFKPMTAQLAYGEFIRRD
jgi:hypothetical protein